MKNCVTILKLHFLFSLFTVRKEQIQTLHILPQATLVFFCFHLLYFLYQAPTKINMIKGGIWGKGWVSVHTLHLYLCNL